MTRDSHVGGRGQGQFAGRRKRGGRGERLMVPDAEFSSYYGRQILKTPVWEKRDIGGYLFTGGLAAGSALIAAGADLSGQRSLRRVARLTSVGALGVSFIGLIHDLGRPARFVNMLRVVKPTSPMSVGTWILSAFAPGIGIAALSEVPIVLPPAFRPAVSSLARSGGIASAAVAPAVATYTAVLFADTAVPTWNASYRSLPFLFAGSALGAASGAGLIGAPVAETSSVRRLAVMGAALDLFAAHHAESGMGVVAETMRDGSAGQKLKLAKGLTVAGAVGAATLAGRSRVAAVACGAAMIAGSLLTRLGFFEAGVASTKDPKYVVVPQRDRVDAGQPIRD